jgi:putative SOS response-associated peptidase YedK
MCGRYGRRSDKQRIAEAMQVNPNNVFEEDLPPSYNVAPETYQPIVRLSRDSGERELALLRWGLVPFWSRNGKSLFSSINARAEGLETRPAYREAFQKRRCLVPADFFYEWQRLDEKTKQPYAIELKNQPIFALAGLWDSWKDKATGTRLETYTIVTTIPNELMASIHNRMPVILAPRNYERWLAPAASGQLPIDLLRPFPAQQMYAWKVSRAVGNVKNDQPELLAPI